MILLLLAALAADEWRFDVIHRNGLTSLRGLILERSAAGIRIRCIRRRPGKPTLCFTDNVPASEIRLVEALPPAERKKLEHRLETLKKERQQLHALEQAIGKGTAAPSDLIEMKPTDWPEEPKRPALCYASAHFKLVAAGRPELAQLAAVYLEQVYEAYARALPPRRKGGPTTILLTASISDYRAMTKARKLDLLNPAFFDPERNQVVCGSDMSRLMDERDKVRAHHARLRGEIRQRRAELAKAFKGKPPSSLLAPLADAEKRIGVSERRNAAVLALARQRLFQRLYHESFHAYLSAYVYPAKDDAVPLWLNEGLAQVFESAIVEAGELRLDLPDRQRLGAAKEALAKKTLPSLAELLRSGAEGFPGGPCQRPAGVGSALPGGVGLGPLPDVRSPAAGHGQAGRLRQGPGARRRPGGGVPRTGRAAVAQIRGGVPLLSLSPAGRRHPGREMTQGGASSRPQAEGRV